MTIDKLDLLGGVALTIGGGLATLAWITFAFLDPDHQHYVDPHWFPLNVMVIAGGVFMALGLPSFYSKQALQTSYLGLIGFILLFVGIVIPYIAVHSIETVTMPNIPPWMMRFVAVGAPSAFLGIIITGITTWRAGVFPPALGIVFVASALLGLLTVIPGIPAWLGRNLASCGFTACMAWAGLFVIGN
jgi:hypothetical protein